MIRKTRTSFLWPILREAFPYAAVAFIISVAAYEGHIMRGAFASVPKGELEAARSMGMGRFTVLRRIWLPRAIQNVLPTLAGEAVLFENLCVCKEGTFVKECLSQACFSDSTQHNVKPAHQTMQRFTSLATS